jgi:hypothetical protein
MNRTLYAVHRWVSLAALVQLLVWTGTGFFFAVMPIERIRGEDRSSAPPPAPVPWERVGPLPAAALAGAEEVVLRVVDGRPLLVARAPGGRRWAVEAEGGRGAEIDAEAARRIARADQAGSPPAAAPVRIEEAPVEYRGRPLPAWRVDLDDGRGTRVYVDAVSGAITARRNGLWRAYDLLWGFHIMDWGGRDDFNNPWLVGFAALGLLTAGTGTAVWTARAARALRRRSPGEATLAPSPRPPQPEEEGG